MKRSFLFSVGYWLVDKKDKKDINIRRKYFFENVGEGAGGPPLRAGGKGLRPDFSVFFIFFVYDTPPYTKTIRDEEKRDTDQKAPNFLSDLSWAPKSPRCRFPTFVFASTRTGGALSLVHPSFTKSAR